MKPSDDDIFVWKVTLNGPKGTPYEGGHFRLTFKAPEDYP